MKEQRSSKHKSSRDDKPHKRRHKHDDDSDRKHKRKRKDEGSTIVDDDHDEEDMWVEKNIDMDGDRVSTNAFPNARFSIQYYSH